MDVYWSDADKKLMRELGLSFEVNRALTDIGTVIVYEAEPDGEFGPKPATTVKVWCGALPAKFWRFDITRPRDDCDVVDGAVIGVYEPLEHIVLTTGSGSFFDYWPTVLMFAQHTMDAKYLVGVA